MRHPNGIKSGWKDGKHIGAGVLGTASPGKHARLREMGIDHTIDYRSQDAKPK